MHALTTLVPPLGRTGLIVHCIFRRCTSLWTSLLVQEAARPKCRTYINFAKTAPLNEPLDVSQRTCGLDKYYRAVTLAAKYKSHSEGMYCLTIDNVDLLASINLRCLTRQQ